MSGLLVLIKVGFVFGLLIITLRVVGKLYAPGAKAKSRSGALVQVLGRQSVGRNADVTVVSLGDRTLVLGVTEHSVSVVTELDNEEAVETVSLPAAPARTQAPVQVPSWRDLLDNLREKTVRR